jgi:hypothetical protein
MTAAKMHVTHYIFTGLTNIATIAFFMDHPVWGGVFAAIAALMMIPD